MNIETLHIQNYRNIDDCLITCHNFVNLGTNNSIYGQTIIDAIKLIISSYLRGLTLCQLKGLPKMSNNECNSKPIIDAVVECHNNLNDTTSIFTILRHITNNNRPHNKYDIDILQYLNGIEKDIRNADMNNGQIRMLPLFLSIENISFDDYQKPIKHGRFLNQIEEAYQYCLNGNISLSDAYDWLYHVDSNSCRMYYFTGTYKHLIYYIHKIIPEITDIYVDYLLHFHYTNKITKVVLNQMF